MRRLSFSLLTATAFGALTAFSVPAKAQHLNYDWYEIVHGSEMKNTPANIDNQYQDIKGEAYFNNQWMAGAAVADNGKTYAGLRLKFDWYQNKFYMNVHDTIYDLSDAPVRRYILYPSLMDTITNYKFQKGFSGGGLLATKYVQVFASGKLSFIKFRSLEMKDVHDDSPLTTIKRFIGQDAYYLVRSDGQTIPVKLNKKTLEKEMADKWKEVSGQAKDKEVSFSDEDGWRYLVNWYNTLASS